MLLALRGGGGGVQFPEKGYITLEWPIYADLAGYIAKIQCPGTITVMVFRRLHQSINQSKYLFHTLTIKYNTFKNN